MKTMKKRGLATLTAIILLLSLAPQTTFAADNPSAAMAALSSLKSETVYVNLGSDGSAENIYVVNAFDVDATGVISDYGNYTEIKNLTDMSTLTNENGHITAAASGGTFYYQGKLVNFDLPWKISIRYYLDGEEKTVDELAGANGDFELRIHISAGGAQYQSFYEQYMMQISMSLNKELFTDIRGDNASINVVGKTASISFTHSKNTEATYSIRAKVSGFEMEPIQFRAAVLGNVSLDVNLDDFLGEFDSLSDGTGALNDNAGLLADGSNSFNSGLSTMSQQAKDLSGSINTLYTSAGKLNDGAVLFGETLSGIGSQLGSLPEKLAALKQALGEIAAGSSQFNDKLIAYCGGVSSLATASSKIAGNLSALNTQASSIPAPNAALVAYAESLTADSDPNLAALANAYLAQNGIISNLTAGIGGINTAYSQFDTSLQSLSTSGAQLTDGYATLNSALQQLNDSISGLSDALGSFSPENISKLTDSYAQLQTGVNTLYKALGQLDAATSEKLVPGISTMISSYEKLNSATGKLAAAITTLDESVTDIPDKLKEKIDEFLAAYLSDDAPKVSFVSDKNTVNSVLFVMQTDGIAKSANTVQEDAAPRKPETFVEKFLNLFGLFKPEE